MNKKPKISLMTVLFIAVIFFTLFGPLLYRMSIDPTLFDDNCLGSFVPYENTDLLPFGGDKEVPECEPVVKT